MIITSVVGYDPARVTVVQEGSAAEAAGLKEGDLDHGIQRKAYFHRQGFESLPTLSRVSG